MNNPRGVIVITFDVLIPPTWLSLMVSPAGFYYGPVRAHYSVPPSFLLVERSQSLPVIPSNYPDSPHVSYRASLA